MTQAEIDDRIRSLLAGLHGYVHVERYDFIDYLKRQGWREPEAELKWRETMLHNEEPTDAR